MNTIQLTVNTTNSQLQEILIAQFAEIGFDCFQETPQCIIACVPENNFNEAEAMHIVQQHGIVYSKQIIAPQNWNAIWESNFSPMQVGNFIGIRAHFHESFSNVKHQIIITPKMSFGTGHHATTYMMMQLMEQINFKELSVFDYGTGTGILAIVAEQLGANHIVAVDYDDWCIENAMENIQINQCKHIAVEKNDTAKTEEIFDVVLANINKHIITANFLLLQQATKPNGTIVLSGLLQTDEADILQLAATNKWKHVQTLHKDQWIAMQFLANVK